MTSQLIVRLRERILTGVYAPGVALRQDILAGEFGTSKIPVREALVRLQSEGLVSIFPNRGFQVRPLATSELDEIFSLRLLMEPTAAALGAKLATAADQRAASEALESLNAAMATDGVGFWAAESGISRAAAGAATATHCCGNPGSAACPGAALCADSSAARGTGQACRA